METAAGKVGGVNAPQDMVLWPGVVLTAVFDGMTKEGIYNSQLLRLESWKGSKDSEGNIRLTCVEGGDEYCVTHGFCARNLRLAYAMSYASMQGRSCAGTVALWDTKHGRLSRRHLVMGLSRATAEGLVWQAD